MYLYIWSSVGAPPDHIWSMDLTPAPPVVVEGGLLTS